MIPQFIAAFNFSPTCSRESFKQRILPESGAKDEEEVKYFRNLTNVETRNSHNSVMVMQKQNAIALG